MRRFVAALLAWLLWTAAAPAADFEAGVNAYERGDYAAAYGEFLPLAERGDASAQVLLGLMYLNGRGVPQSGAQAVEWYRKAAERGNAQAQFGLGFMYYRGQGVPEDYVRAYAWLNLAAAGEDKEAAEVRDLLRNIITAAQLAEAQRLSAELFGRIEGEGED